MQHGYPLPDLQLKEPKPLHSSCAVGAGYDPLRVPDLRCMNRVPQRLQYRVEGVQRQFGDALVAQVDPPCGKSDPT